jgi:hypothetical protein
MDSEACCRESSSVYKQQKEDIKRKSNEQKERETGNEK